MKKSIKVIVALLLVCALFAGCGVLCDQERTCEDLTITIPGHFLDMSDQDYAKGMNFLYGFNDIAVVGIRETKESLAFYDADLTLEEYGALVMQGNGLDGDMELKEGLYTFEYEASNAGQTFTYLGAVFEGEEAFWIVQAYCLSDEYEQHQADMMKWLKSVKV